MSEEHSLEDLRSKIMASMGQSEFKHETRKRTLPSESARNEYKPQASPAALPSGPRETRRDGYQSSRGLRYSGNNQQQRSLPSGPAGPSRGPDRGYNSNPGRGYNRDPNRDYSRNSEAEYSRGFDRGYARGVDRGQDGGRMRGPDRSRYQQAPRSSYNTHTNGPPRGGPLMFREADLVAVIPIDQRQRMKTTRWDVTPEGFEKVPSERAKLSGLFPQPGEPQELDRSKLARVAMHGGTKSRRTRILFEDTTHSNLLFSKLSCQIIVNTGGQEDNVKLLPELKTELASYVTSLDTEYSLKKFVISPENVVVEFNSAECTVMALSCRSYFNTKLGLKNVMWRRPHEYVQQLDHLDRLCGSNIIAIAELKELDEDNIKEMIASFGVTCNYVKSIRYKDSNGQDISTGCALVELDNLEEETLEKLQSLKWFKPNKSNLTQTTALITFQSISQIVQEPVHPESRVLLLLNCVDPLDLKNSSFADEIEETLLSTLEDVDTVTVRRPHVDYRLNFEHIGEGIGNVYAKFKTLEAAKKAMRQFPGSKFNDRTILCSYVNEEDFEIAGVL